VYRYVFLGNAYVKDNDINFGNMVQLLKIIDQCKALSIYCTRPNIA
jgi:hypothetical protein